MREQEVIIRTRDLSKKKSPMQPAAVTDVYFALDGQGTVTAIKITEGEIIERKVFSESQLSPSWVNALYEMRATMEINTTEPCGISFLQPHGSRSLGLDRTGFATSDREPEPAVPYMQGLLQPHLDSSLPFGADSGVESPFEIPGLSDTWDDVDPFNLGVPAFLQSPPIDHVSRDSNMRTPRADDGGCESRPMGLKREQKLHRTLHSLEYHPVLSQEDHNRQIEGLYNGPQLLTCSQDVSMVQFATVLGRHSSVSATVKTIHGLLSWNICGLEEDRVIKEERMSPYIAAKQMNQKMTSALRRRGKSNDWASDGRRAAKAVFGAVEGAGIQEQSFALVLLAEVFSLDYLLKIAHFPSLRMTFQEQFARIIESRRAEWNLYLESGYKVFDYQLFLRLKSHPLPGYEPTSRVT